MITVPIAGSICLGIVIGWLVRYFLLRFDSFTPQILGSTVSIFLGGGVVVFLGGDETVKWVYPIGLLIGFVIYSTIAWASGGNARGSLYLARKRTISNRRPQSENQDKE